MKETFQYRKQAHLALLNHSSESISICLLFGLLAALCISPLLIENWGTFTRLIQTTDFQKQLELSTKIGESKFITLNNILNLFITPLQYAFWIALLGKVRNTPNSITQETIQLTKQYYVRLLSAGTILAAMSMLVNLVTLGIGGLVLLYLYRMVPLLLHDYPELSIQEAFKISRQMTKGYRLELLKIDAIYILRMLAIFFIGCVVIGIVTSFIPNINMITTAILSLSILGLSIIFIAPYMFTALAAFYDDLRILRVVDDSQIQEPIETEDTREEQAEETEQTEETQGSSNITEEQ
jgi:hypothetical protein